MSFRTKILLTVAFFMSLVLGLITVNLLLDARRREQDEQSRQADLLAGLMSDWARQHPALQDAYVGCDWPAVNKALAESSLVSDWKIASRRKPDAASDERWVLETTSRVEQRDISPDEAAVFGQVLQTRRPYIKVDNKEQAAYVPFTTRYNETFVARLDLKGIQAPPGFTEALKEILWLMGVAIGLMLVILYVLLNRLVLRPLNALADASRRVAAGDYSRPVAELDTYDEMHQLVRAFNEMMRRMDEDLKLAHDRVTHTERRLLVAQRLSTTGALAAGIAHEINNPLGGMINAAESLRSGELTPQQRAQYLELIADGLGRVKDIVGKILHFTPREVRRDRTDLREVVDRAVALVRHRAENRQVALDVRPPDGEPIILGDAAELQQAVLNVALNAIDAVAERTGRVWIDLAVAPEGVRLSVHDNGPGMTEAQLAQCLEPFYTTKDVGEGTGLGLKVSRSIVQSHGGDLYIESTPGEGTTVTFALPAPNAKILELQKR